MDSIKAFATNYSDSDSVQEGMTLRDYFAAKAMEGLVKKFFHPTTDYFENLAIEAYDIADAMLKEREK